MAQFGMTFDATKYDPATVGAQLPVSPAEGWPVVITASEMKETQAKDGSGFLELTLQIIDGDHKGQEGKYRLNLFNKNEQAINIAYKQMSAICHVVGVFQVSDSAQLHGKPFRAIVGLQKEQKEGTAYTEVKGVKDINGNDPGKQTGSSAPAWGSPAPVATASVPPWVVKP